VRATSKRRSRLRPDAGSNARGFESSEPHSSRKDTPPRFMPSYYFCSRANSGTEVPRRLPVPSLGNGRSLAGRGLPKFAQGHSKGPLYPDDGRICPLGLLANRTNPESLTAIDSGPDLITKDVLQGSQVWGHNHLDGPMFSHECVHPLTLI
jgi:hypothetical protein